MSILINKSTRLVVQGITGRDGLFHALKMKEYGVKRSREQALNIGEEKLKSLVETVYSVQSDIKFVKLSPENALQTVNNAIFFK